jgi:DHA2 family multidrug resistance protein-like MFS transporter
MDQTTQVTAGKKEWIGLAVLALPALLVAVDVFVMLLALPRLSADLGANSTQQLWVMDIYGFMIAGFLITMGTLGDRIGRRKLLLIGGTAFGLASVLAAYSTSVEMLIVARALLGLAGATLSPSTLALISNMFRDAKQRSLAIGIWLVCFIGGAAVGPVIGGVMLEHFWWGSVFLLGVPVMVLLLILGPALLPEYRDESAGRLDLASVALSLGAILPLIFGLKEVAKQGFRPLPVTALIVGGIVGMLFIRRQRRLDDPFLDLGLFSNREFRVAVGSMVAGTMLMGATMVFITQALQLVFGLEPLQAGIWMVPSMLCSIVSFQCTPLVARRVRPAYLISGGLVLAVAGLTMLTQVGSGASASFLITAFSMMSLGAGPLVTLSVDLVVGSAPPERAGSAAALSETGNEFGFALGIATLGTVGTAIYRARVAGGIPDGVPRAAADAARDTLAGASAAARDLSPDVADALLASARDAFLVGFNLVAAIAAIVMAVVAVVVLTQLRGRPAYGSVLEASGEAEEREESRVEEVRDADDLPIGDLGDVEVPGLVTAARPTRPVLCESGNTVE